MPIWGLSSRVFSKGLKSRKLPSWAMARLMMTKLLVFALLMGAAAGLIGALCGVGGGILLVPAFTLLLGMEQKAAVATSLAVIIISAGSGTLNHTLNKTGLIDWRLVAFTAAGVALASWFGSDLMRSLSNQQLTRIFAVLLILVGIRMLFVRG